MVCGSRYSPLLKRIKRALTHFAPYMSLRLTCITCRTYKSVLLLFADASLSCLVNLPLCLLGHTLV